jgi:hypothetical protein
LQIAATLANSREPFRVPHSSGVFSPKGGPPYEQPPKRVEANHLMSS